MKTRPLISVIIPVYNGERYLAEAIDSVLMQTYSFKEVIVLDDGSSDRTAEIAGQFGSRVRYSFHSNRGIAFTRNQGVALAQGDFFAFQDADDLWVRDKLELQIAAFDGNADLEAVFGHVEQFLSPELAEELAGEVCCPGSPQPGYNAGSMLIKREAFARVGPFDAQWGVSEFVSWYIRAVEAGLRTLMLPATLMRGIL